MILEEYTWFHEAERGVKQVHGGYAPTTAPEEAYTIHEVQYVAYGVLAPIILFVGILGNLLVLLLLRLPQFKGVVFSYFTVLAVADLLSLVFCISPLHHILAGATLHHSTAVWYSYFELLFLGVAMSSSVLIVVSITVHRFISVCRPAEFKRINTHHFAWSCMTVAFGVSVVSWLPVSFLREPRMVEECQSSSFTPPDDKTWWVACLVHDVSDKGYFVAYAWVRQTIVSFLPIIIVVSLNILTLRGFMRHRKMRNALLNRQVSGESPETSSTREERQLMGLLIAVMSSFVITIVPSGIANAINIGVKTTELNFVIFNAVANILEILNHTLNFYLYILCSKPVRDTLKEYYAKYSSDLNRIVEARFGARGDTKEERSRNSESPTSESVQNKGSQKVYAVSCTRLDSSRYVSGLENDLRREKNRKNENLQQENLFPHVIQGKSNNMARLSGRDNPNFEFGS